MYYSGFLAICWVLFFRVNCVASEDYFRSGLNSLPKTFPEGVTSIYLRDLHLQEIPSDAFEGIPTLQSINFISSTIKKLDRYSFRKLENMESIYFISCVIDDVMPYAFTDLRNISQISMSASTIHRIHKNGFSGLSEIKSFDLSSMVIEIIDGFAFDGFENVGSFAVHNSNITILRQNAFQDWSGIGFFIMDYNKFANMECGNADFIFSVTNMIIFHNNNFDCSCDLFWVTDNHDIATDVMETNWCTKPDSKEIVVLRDVTPEVLKCAPADRKCAINASRVDQMSTLSVTQEFVTTATPKLENKATKIAENEGKYEISNEATTAVPMVTNRESASMSTEPFTSSSTVNDLTSVRLDKTSQSSSIRPVFTSNATEATYHEMKTTQGYKPEQTTVQTSIKQTETTTPPQTVTKVTQAESKKSTKSPPGHESQQSVNYANINSLNVVTTIVCLLSYVLKVRVF